MKNPDVRNNPLIKQHINIYRTQIEKALDCTFKMERAVVPIYWTLKNETRPEQVGSGVLIELGGEYFVFSASHVFDDIKQFQLLIGVENGGHLTSLAGERFSTKKGPSGTHRDDPIDASVFHIQSGITEPIKEKALNYKDLDLGERDECKFIFNACGFRVKKSNTAGGKVTCKQECFVSFEYNEKDYDKLALDRQTHLALVYEAQRLLDWSWKKSPKPLGISGGAIFKANGITPHGLETSSINPRGKLTAITISHKQEKANELGAIIGTRITVHLGLIMKYLPSALTDLLD